MRFKPLIILMLVLFYSTSCTISEHYYQLYKVKSKDVTKTENAIIYENNDIKVIYNFWDNYGNSSFLVHNKLNDDIFIDLQNSHLIINGLAKTYFQNRTYEKNSSKSFSHKSYDYNNFNSTDFYNTSEESESVSETSNTISYTEKKIICIPSKAAKKIIGFKLSNSIYRDCYLFRYPSTNSYYHNPIKTKQFNSNNSPLNVRNIISYGLNRENINNKIENDFWVFEITNYPLKEFYGKKVINDCDKETMHKEKYFLYKNPGNFYIKYKKSSNTTRIEH